MRRRQEGAFTMSSSNSKIKIARNSFEYQVEKRVPFGKYSILNFQIFTVRGTTVVASAEMSGLRKADDFQQFILLSGTKRVFANTNLLASKKK